MGKRFLHNRAAVVTVAFVLLIALIGILAPLLAPHDPYVTDILNKFAPYSLEYPLGTIALGALLGVMAGYFRGVVEEIIMRVVDVMLSFPSQIMVFAVVGLLGINVQNVIIANVFIKWAWYARMIRTGVMQYRDRNFVQFSRCVGMPERFILFRHLLPSITSDLAVLASLDVGWAIINISTLSFLGLGVQAPTPEWGAMLNEAKDVLTSNPTQMIAPGIAIVVLVCCFNLMGDALRDVLDPKEDPGSGITRSPCPALRTSASGGGVGEGSFLLGISWRVSWNPWGVRKWKIHVYESGDGPFGSWIPRAWKRQIPGRRTAGEK